MARHTSFESARAVAERWTLTRSVPDRLPHPRDHWDRLRREEPGEFAQPIDPAPEPNGWVHLHVVVGTDSVAVYVDGEAERSLAVRRKTPGATGAVGYWAGHESDGDFRRLRVATREPR